MKSFPTVRLCTGALIATCLALPSAALAASAAECNALGSRSFPQTQIASATWNAATATRPEHCRITGVIGPGRAPR